MLNEETYKQLMEMKLHGIAHAFNEYLNLTEKDALTFEERFGLMVDREWTDRKERQLKYRLARAKLREEACVEDIDYRHPRGLDRALVAKLQSCDWIKEHHNLIITGPTGTGKTFLACALAHKACREGLSALYVRIPRLLQDLFISKGDGRYGKLLKSISKTDLLLLDDWGMSKITSEQSRDLLEIIDDRHALRSTLITSQFPVDHWHELIEDPTLADAILDRIIHNAYKINLKGDSMRKKRSKLTQPPHKD